MPAKTAAFACASPLNWIGIAGAGAAARLELWKCQSTSPGPNRCSGQLGGSAHTPAIFIDDSELPRLGDVLVTVHSRLGQVCGDRPSVTVRRHHQARPTDPDSDGKILLPSCDVRSIGLDLREASHGLALV